ncbi:MAG TPA: ABC transporter substrate-binding protein [Pseudonocardiaceae bacterium]|jgi:multiple sugar transport system substrate-binding protein
MSLDISTVLSRRAVLSAAALAAAGYAATAGCARSTPSGSRPELVWASGGLSAADLRPAQDITDLWHALHPRGPGVRLVPTPASPDDAHELLWLELNAHLSNFDIVALDVVWTAEFAKRGWLVDLTELRPDIEPVTLRRPLQTAIWDGKLWAAPDTTDAGILYYRKDLLRPDQVPQTWRQLIDTGREIGRPRNMAPFVADGIQNEGLVVQYLEYFWGLGGEVLSADGHSVLFDPGTATQAIEIMKDAYDKGDYLTGFDTMNLEDSRAAFQTGKAVFMRSWPYGYQQMNETDPNSKIIGKVGIAPLPAIAEFGSITALGGHNLAVSAFSRNIPAAIEFVRFVSTARQVQQTLGQSYSLAPTMRAVYENPDGDPMLALLDQVLGTAKPRPATPQWSVISAQMQQLIFSAYTGTRDPGNAARAMRRFLDATTQGS